LLGLQKENPVPSKPQASSPQVGETPV